MRTHLIFESKTDSLRHDLLLHFGDDGSITFDGCISGEIVKETYGDWDYKFAVTIKERDAIRLCNHWVFDPPNTLILW